MWNEWLSHVHGEREFRSVCVCLLRSVLQWEPTSVCQTYVHISKWTAVVVALINSFTEIHGLKGEDGLK